MTVTIPAPRLLPTTIAVMAILLLFKVCILTMAAITHGPKSDTTLVSSAIAASAEPGDAAAKPPSSAVAKKPAAPVEAKVAATPSQPTAPAVPVVSDSEKALLQELRQRRQELDARADGMAARESVLVAAEQKLATRVGELQALQTKLEGFGAQQKKKEDENWQGLVKLYEAMKPKDAATIFNDLSMPVLLQVLDRMKDVKAAAIMAAMTPDRARDVTSELAQMRTGKPIGGGLVGLPKSQSAGG